MNSADAAALLRSVTSSWVEDPDSDAVWAGEYEGRWGVRMAQRARDFTTLWFDVGDITVHFEAYLLPAPVTNREAVYRYCLARSSSSWPAAIVADRRGELYAAGRIPLEMFSSDSLDTAVGAVHTLVDSTFPTLLRLAFEKREKSS